MEVSVVTVGWSELTGQLSIAIPQFAVAEAALILTDAANEVVALAQAEYVPVLTGALLRSGMVADPEFESGVGVSVEMGFGGPGSGAESYALEQHEWLFYRHVIGSAKYLEIPFNILAPALEEKLANVLVK